MPTLFVIFGLRFYFFAGDHEPIHVHVIKGDNDAKIQMVPSIRVVYNHGLSNRDIKRAIELVTMYKEDIIAKWNEYDH